MSMGLDTFHCTMVRINTVMIKAMKERRYFDSPESISYEIIAEIIKDLFRIMLYGGTEYLYITGRPYLAYLEKSWKRK